MPVITVLIADDHAEYRLALRSSLDRETDISVVGEAADGEAAILTAADLRPDVVLMDIAMPELSGIEATRRIVAAWPECRVLAISLTEDPRRVHAIKLAGAQGFISKATVPASLSGAIRKVAAGERYP